MCLSVCLSVLSRSQLLTDFDKIWHRRLEPETKEPFRWGGGSKSNKGIPYFYPILLQGALVVSTDMLRRLTNCRIIIIIIVIIIIIIIIKLAPT